jgi:GxxExxY protein
MKNGYSALVYSKCLAIEFDKAGIKYQKELEEPIYYDRIIISKRRVDFMVENKMVGEIKAIIELTSENLAQALNYLECRKLEVGRLINFGSKSLQFKRLINQHQLQDLRHPINTAIQNPINPRS